MLQKFLQHNIHVQMNVFFDDNHRYPTYYGFDYGGSVVKRLYRNEIFFEN